MEAGVRRGCYFVSGKEHQKCLGLHYNDGSSHEDSRY